MKKYNLFVWGMIAGLFMGAWLSSSWIDWDKLYHDGQEGYWEYQTDVSPLWTPGREMVSAYADDGQVVYIFKKWKWKK